VRISAKHQSAPKGNEVQMSAIPFRVAPISTNPVPVISIFSGAKLNNTGAPAAEGTVCPMAYCHKTVGRQKAVN